MIDSTISAKRMHPQRSRYMCYQMVEKGEGVGNSLTHVVGPTLLTLVIYVAGNARIDSTTRQVPSKANGSTMLSKLMETL